MFPKQHQIILHRIAIPTGCRTLGTVPDMNKVPQLLKCIHGLGVESASKLKIKYRTANLGRTAYALNI